jgi:hypothetical protein
MCAALAANGLSRISTSRRKRMMLSFYHGLRVGTDKGFQESLQCMEGTATDSRCQSDIQVAAGTQIEHPLRRSPQQSNKFIEARHVDLLKTSVVVLVVLNEKDFVWPGAARTDDSKLQAAKRMRRCKRDGSLIRRTGETRAFPNARRRRQRR